MGKKALLVLAEGFEEIEASAPMDILRRAEVELTVAGLFSREVAGAHDIKFVADKTLDEAGEDYDAVVFPGGLPGAENLANSEKVKTLIKKLHQKGKIIAAICASPAFVLAPLGILKGKRVTGYPGTEGKFAQDTQVSAEAVTVDGNIITAKGPAFALEFGLKIAELLAGKEKADSVKSRLLL